MGGYFFWSNRMRTISLLGAAFLVFATAALAHDQLGNPNWIAKGHFTSPIDGSHCCGVSDCVELDDGIVHPNGVGYGSTASPR